MQKQGMMNAISAGAAGTIVGAATAFLFLTKRPNSKQHEDSGIAVLKSGHEVNRLIKSLANDGESCTNDGDFLIQAIVRSDSAPAVGTKTKELQDSGPSVIAWFEKYPGRIMYYTKADAIHMNCDSSKMFYKCKQLKDLQGIADWGASRIVDMHAMFGWCTDLKDLIHLAYWNVGNVKNMAGLFANCWALENLMPLMAWNVGNVLDMSGMFRSCTSIKALTGLHKWKVAKVKTMQKMFGECYSLASLDALTGWNPCSLNNIRDMFTLCKSLKDASALDDWYPCEKSFYRPGFPYECRAPKWVRDSNDLTRVSSPTALDLSKLSMSCEKEEMGETV